MSSDQQPILVFGATGQQGGSVAHALLQAGARVRALIRNPASAKAAALAARGVELVRGDLAEGDAILRAMEGVRGVFSVQPSSPGGELSDADEVRYGVSIADAAAASEAGHLVYSSSAAVSDRPTGVGHFDSKERIEAHVRLLPIAWTIVRPVAFMEMLMMPGFGLDEGRFTFFPKPDQVMQLLAVRDIGRFVAPIFADAARFSGQTFEIASDAVTGAEIGRALSTAAERPIAYSRFSDEVLSANPFLRGLTDLLDAGPLAGHADLTALSRLNPAMQSFATWLAGDGQPLLAQALTSRGDWAYDRK